MSPRLRVLGAVAALAVVAIIAGCAPVTDPTWSPAAWPAATLRVVAAQPAPLDPSAVPGLSGKRLRNDAVGVQARFESLPGTGAVVAPFNATVDAVVRAAVDARAATVGVAYRPTAFPIGAGLTDRGCIEGSTLRPAAGILADPTLGPVGGVGTAVVCDIVAAGGTVLGQRIRTVTSDAGGSTSDASVILYADTATGTVTTAEELWTDAAAAALGADIVEAVRRDAGALSLTPSDGGVGAPVAAIQAALASTLPTDDGALVVTIASGFATPELTDLGLAATATALTVEVPAAIAEPLLTEEGRAVLAAAQEPYAGPPDVPAAADWLPCSLVPCVALTYDDGPSTYTATLLDALRSADAAATFFLLGGNASRHPELVQRVAAEGHEIGSHTWNHPHLPDIEDDAVLTQEIGDTRALLQHLSGQPVAMFRPPYGDYDARVLATAGLPAILWNVDTLDWTGPPDEELVRRGAAEADPGGIILVHDIHEKTVRVSPAIIAGLQDRGFTLATVSQLFGGSLPTSGAWRSAPPH